MTRSRRNQPPPRTGPPLSIIALGVGALVIVAAAVAAVALAPASPTPTSSVATGSPSPTGASSVSANADLAPFEPNVEDPALGRPIPTVDGRSFDGSPVNIKADGHPKLIVFLAHWCPHCQREVPVVQAWIDAKGAPAGVDMVSVVTAIDANRPNYPPDAWLAREHWSVPVIVDADGQIATRYGLTAFPFWVAVHADGSVAHRVTGELTPDQLDGLVELAAAP